MVRKTTTIWGTQLPVETVRASHFQLPSKYLNKTSAVEAWRFLRLATPEMKKAYLRKLAGVPSSWRHTGGSLESLNSIFSKLEKFRLTNQIHPSDLSEGYPYFVDVRQYEGLNEETKDNLDKLLWSAHGILVEIFKTREVLPAMPDISPGAFNRAPQEVRKKILESIRNKQTTKETEMKRKDAALGAIGVGISKGMMTLGEMSRLPEAELKKIYEAIQEDHTAEVATPTKSQEFFKSIGLDIDANIAAQQQWIADLAQEWADIIAREKAGGTADNSDAEKPLDIFPVKFDIFIEDDKEVTVVIPLAGAEKKHIESVKLVDSVLKITGTIPADPTIVAYMEGTLHQIEDADREGRDCDARLLPRGDLRLTLDLSTTSAPEFDPNVVSATMKNGLLKIVIGIKQPNEVDIKINKKEKKEKKEKTEAE